MQYLVTIYRSDDYDAAVSEGESMAVAIDALNEEMIAAGIRLFAGGLLPVSHARSINIQLDGDVSIHEGAYLKTDMHEGGFWILDVADLEEALSWGRKAAIACRASVQVRPFY